MAKLKDNQFSSKAKITDNGIFQSNFSVQIKDDPKQEHNNDYNPFDHRDNEHPNSDVRSFANLLKSSLGSGILAMPAAFKNAGTVVGLVGTVLMGIICSHCVYMLVKTSQEVCRVVKKPSLGYSETFEAVLKSGPRSLRPFGKASRIFTDWAFALTILGAGAVYVVLLAQSVKQIIDNFYPSLNLTTEMYCMMFLIPLALFAQIKNLKYLAPFSALANVLLIITFVICLFYIFQDFPEFSSRSATTDIRKLPLFICTVIFAMEGIGVVLPVENTMAKPQRFLGCPGVLSVAMVCVVVLYTLMGLFGYMKYGDEVLGSITLNLPVNDAPALAAKIMIIVAIFFTYLLHFYVPMEIIWRNINGHVSLKYHNISQVIIRASFVALTVAIAAALPKLEEIIGLVGALFYSILGFIAPAVMETVFWWNRNLGTGRWILWKNVVIFAFGFFVLVTGCTQSINELMK